MMLTVALAVSLAALAAGGGAMPPREPAAVPRVPDEPGAIVLPQTEPTLQAVAADLDGDGAPEVVRLVGRDEEPLSVEAWGDGPEGWSLIAPPMIAVHGVAGQAELAYTRRPVRLLVRRAGGGQRVTLLRQPDFSEPGDARDRCLLLDDIVLSGGTLRLVRVADPGASADALHVIDLDGDGTDELLATLSTEPLNDASSPTIGRVFRWAGGRFAPPKATQLAVGSGSSPLVLGDSDGVPGDEAAFISTSAHDVLFRVSLRHDDHLAVERSGLAVTDATAVPLGSERGIAVHAVGGGVEVRTWPRGRGLGDPVAEAPLDEGGFLGVVNILDEPRLLVRQTDPEALHVLGLPNLTPPRGNAITRSPAAAALEGGPLGAFVGPLPGGGPGGKPAVIYAGRLLPSDDLPDAAFATRQAALFATLAGAHPVGLVGRDRASLAIWHAPAPGPDDDPRGGRLLPPVFDPAAVVSIAPLDLVRQPETDDGRLEPPLEGATRVGARELAIPPSGLLTEITAPAGSRVYLPNPDPSVVGPALGVGASGTLRVNVPPPPGLTQNVRYRLTLHVVTPAGHGYLASWPVRILARPPDLDAAIVTPPGSADVTLSGRTAPYASLTVAGRAVAVDADGRFRTSVPMPPWPTPVTLIARDPAGNESAVTLTGVGILDYRGLPWAPITLVLVGGVAGILALRVPRSRTGPRPVTDDAVLEELDPIDPV